MFLKFHLHESHFHTTQPILTAKMNQFQRFLRLQNILGKHQHIDASGIGSVLMDADLANPASWRTMEALGGTRTREHYDDVYEHCTVVDYTIDVKKALAEHAGYEDRILCEDQD